MKARLLSIAEVEATEAALRYEERQPGLGDEFLTELSMALERIRRDPRTFARLENYTGGHELRRCSLHRLPYLVVFLLQTSMRQWS